MTTYISTPSDRARQATSPAQVSVPAWKAVVIRTYHRIVEHRLLAEAGGVTFYTLLAIFPGIGALVSLYGLVADPSTIQQHVNSLSGVMPGGATEIVGDQIKRISGNGGGKLGWALALSLGIALWSASSGLKSMFDALNIIYDEKEKRSFVRLALQALLFTIGGVVFIGVAISALVIVPIVLAYVGLGPVAGWILWAGRWPALLVLVGLALAVLYRYGPSRDEAKWRWVTPGSAFAAVVWLGGSMLFSWYAANFGSYNETYGSLGAVVGFMTWIWLSSIVVLIGGAINAEAERQTEADTTKGAPKPKGTRGATVADVKP